MNKGKFVFAQVIGYLPKYEFSKIIEKYKGDYRYRHLTSYNHLLHLVFGQLTACNSLRDICLCLSAHEKSLYHLGFGQTVNESSLSRAGERRDYRIFEELGHLLISIVRSKYAREHIPGVWLPDWDIFALDSTTISCSIKLMSWAYGKYERGAVKMHTLLDLRGSIPAFIHVTHGKWHDSNVLDIIEIIPWAIYAMDKAYVDFEALYRIHKNNAYFITRAKRNMKYEVVDTNYNIDEMTGLRSDHTIKLMGYHPKKYYPEAFRLVKFYDSEKEEELEFITNHFEISALEVANIYRNRWQIETFFKWIKGNLTIKTLWGHSENAVKTHLWAAICTYLLVARIKVSCNTSYSISEVAILLGVSALEKINIRELLEKPTRESLNQNQNFKELNLFDI
ncbi:IS4 family transposase [Bacteroides sp. UBA939]|uniref:IS4 family transposase n=1 Tax=Bacteroides sp. UBA939 TaxID=1946092 RepID=UPI0025C24A7A|nr:IS4 family transposase [Bacteroides sp. UBA939]